MDVKTLIMSNRVTFHMFLREYFADCDPDLWALVAGLAPSDQLPYQVIGEGEVFVTVYEALYDLLELYGYQATAKELGCLTHLLRTFG